jgi:mannose-1-phosphate guanylyltransferase/phosphomannomutase
MLIKNPYPIQKSPPNLSVVILAAGFGTRSGQSSKPKCLLEFSGLPVIEYVLNSLSYLPVAEVIIVVHFQSDQIFDWIKRNSSRYEFNIYPVFEFEPRGTVSSLKFGLRQAISPNTLLFFGDLVIGARLDKHYSRWLSTSSKVFALTHSNFHPFESDILELDFSGNLNFVPKRSNLVLNARNSSLTGIYFLERDYVLEILEGINTGDFEPHVIFKAIFDKSIVPERTIGYVKDIGTPERQLECKNDLASDVIENRTSDSPICLLMDRDSTLCLDPTLHDLSRLDRIVFEDARDLLKQANSIGVPVFIITNQARLSKGTLSPVDHTAFVKRLEIELAQYGVFYDDYFFCPHEEIKVKSGMIQYSCNCRKPNLGLVQQIQRKYGITTDRALLIGDSWRDEQVAHGLQIPFVKVVRDHSTVLLAAKSHPVPIEPDLVWEKIL